MPALYRASFGYLLRHPWQLGLALLGICVGVAVMVAVDLANESSRQAFRLSMDTINGEATHQIVQGPAGVDEILYVRLRVKEGIRSIAPVVEGYVDIGNITMKVLGVDPFAEREFRSYSMSDSVVSVNDTYRRVLTVSGAVLMSDQTARSLNLSPGDRFDVSAGGRAYRAELVAIVSGSDGHGLDNLIIADISTAQIWLAMLGRLTRIDVKIPQHDETVITDKIRNALPIDGQLLNAAGRTRFVTEMSAAFMTNLTAMSLLALLVGVFLIYNSVSFAVLQRRRLIGVLRALGLTRRQTFTLILTEGLVLGTIGAALGVLTGTWLGQQLLVLVSRSINDLYFVVNVTDVSLSPLSAAKGLIAGLSATVISAIVPAMEAASYQPRLALSRSVLEHKTSKLMPAIAIGGIGMVVLAVILIQVSGTSLVAGLTALFLMILGLALCIPITVRACVTLIAPIANKFGGTTARLAISSVGASLSRTSVAIVALAVAVSATVGVSIMVDSFRGSVSDWLGNTLRSDIYISVARGTLDTDLVDELVRVPGVAHHSSSRRVWLESETGRTRIIALKMAPGSYAGVDLLDAEPQDVWNSFDEEGAVIVSEPYAYRHDVRRGDTLTLNTMHGDKVFQIAATYRSYDANAGSVLMSRHTYETHWNDPTIGAIGLYLSPDAKPDEVIEQLRKVSEGRQSLLINSNREIRDMSLQIFDRTFIITDVLYWLAVSVAIIGILGAMMALELERGRELAVLRAIGMTPGQLGTMVTVQTGFMGLLSGLAAIPLGLLMAWVLIDVINRRSFGWQMDMEVSPDVLITALALSVIAAVIAGIFPAYRAASSQPALAMREE
ncbi:MAG: ABC transporter permease [Proteobacteria bacterium]|nr:ABC transporter permease [Pseudomonadota bacterium]